MNFFNSFNANKLLKLCFYSRLLSSLIRKSWTLKISFWTFTKLKKIIILKCRYVFKLTTNNFGLYTTFLLTSHFFSTSPSITAVLSSSFVVSWHIRFFLAPYNNDGCHPYREQAMLIHLLIVNLSRLVSIFTIKFLHLTKTLNLLLLYP